MQPTCLAASEKKRHELVHWRLASTQCISLCSPEQSNEKMAHRSEIYPDFQPSSLISIVQVEKFETPPDSHVAVDCNLLHCLFHDQQAIGYFIGGSPAVNGSADTRQDLSQFVRTIWRCASICIQSSGQRVREKIARTGNAA